MKRTMLIGSLAVIALLYLSWRNHYNNDKTPAPAPVATQGGGQPVPWKDIQPCLKAYEEVMKKYGVTTDKPRKPITKCPDSTYLITLSEAFRADSLVAWMQTQINLYDSAGKGANLNFVVMPGICTAQMLTDVKGPKASTGRISYFIVPMTRTGKVLKGGAAKALMSNPPGSGFEVGGLQP